MIQVYIVIFNVLMLKIGLYLKIKQRIELKIEKKTILIINYHKQL